MIPDHYPLTALPERAYPVRTLRNVLDSDGTVIIHFGRLAGGTALTERMCRDHAKPVLVVDATVLTATDAADAIHAFIVSAGVGRLNVAGPRESEDSRGYTFTRDAIERLLDKLPRDRPRAKAKV